MTALPKRKPARRATMAKPDPEPESRPIPSWADLTAPLQHYHLPVCITDAERAACDAYIDQLHAGYATHQQLLDAWLAAARQATYGPCTDPGFRQALQPELMP